ncbi:hypothetical protein GEMRC1_013407 [Eukaryota sp. GEM-RC1]
MSETPKGVNLSYRRKWEEGSLPTTKTDKKVRVLPVLKDTLKPHSDLDIHKSVSQRSSKTAPGYYRCSLCEVGFHDSISYLDHINGQKHQRRLGRKMLVEKSGVDDVNAVLGIDSNDLDSRDQMLIRLLQLEDRYFRS